MSCKESPPRRSFLSLHIEKCRGSLLRPEGGSESLKSVLLSIAADEETRTIAAESIL